MSKKQSIFLGALLLAFAGLAVLFAFVDLPLSQALYNPTNPLGIFMESYGILVEPLLISFAGILLFRGPRLLQSPSRSQTALGILVLLGSYAYLCYEYSEQGVIPLFAVLILQAVLDLLVLLSLRRLTKDTILRLSRMAAITAVFITITLVIVFLLKTVWGRVRFRELTDIAEFSRWYLPQGLNGHHSFPSGHTSNAATLWVITLFVPFLPKPWQRILCYAVPTAWTLLMAVCRVIAGAHYASDTLFAAGITIAIFYFVRRAAMKTQAEATAPIPQ